MAQTSSCIRGHEHFIPTKFRKHPLCGSVVNIVKADYVFPCIHALVHSFSSHKKRRKFIKILKAFLVKGTVSADVADIGNSRKTKSCLSGEELLFVF